MVLFKIITALISHIIAGLYLQKQKYNKWITTCAWTLFAVISLCVMLFVKNVAIVFVVLLFLQFGTFGLTTTGPIGEKVFLFLTYANAFSISLGITLFLEIFLPQNAFLVFCTIAVAVLVHLFLYNVLLRKYRKAKKHFESGWLRLNIILGFFLAQFMNQYAFDVVDQTAAHELLWDFVIFCVIFVTTLMFIFDSVKTVAEKNKKVNENDRLKHIAYKDVLTDMQNRMAYERFIEKAKLKHEMGDDASFVFAMLDIDDFKSINDTQGHAKGDEILKLVGESLVRHFAGYECESFRIGGDEFVLLLECVQLSDAEEQIRLLNKALFASDGITLSYGCSLVDFSDAEPFEAAFERADRIMYDHKHRKKIGV